MRPPARMKTLCTLLLFLLLGSPTPAPSAAPCDVPLLDETTFEHWRDYLKPAEGELRWQGISWRGQFWEGMEEATEKDLPVLLWAMNGHPLGCT